MKRKLFIGSSTKELSIARQLKKQIDSECGDWIHTEIWDEGSVFSLNKSALDSLMSASRRFDYGILIATKDDIVISKKTKQYIPRDNVMFEMGMFLGSLGLTRAFLLVEKQSKLPTDYNGVTVSYFNKRISGSLKNAVSTIVKALNNTSTSYNLKPIPSVALALGYFDNFLHPLAIRQHEQKNKFKVRVLLPKNIKDIYNIKSTYRNNNPSIEKGVFNPKERPIVFELQNKKNHFWDIPSTLTTLSKLMDIIIPSTEVGVNKEKQDWIEHELRNFKGTIETLVKESKACKGRIAVSYLN